MSMLSLGKLAGRWKTPCEALPRIGDSPIIGAGTYADNATCAVSGTGIGEEFIRHAVAYDTARGVTVLFGGDDDDALADTWEWDGERWTHRPVSGPSVRNGHAMA